MARKTISKKEAAKLSSNRLAGKQKIVEDIFTAVSCNKNLHKCKKKRKK